MKRILFILSIISFFALPSWSEVFPALGIDSVSAEWFDTWWHQGNLVNYLDNYNNYVIYQSETTGRWDEPDRVIFSVQGNSHRWNRYYLDGFRTDQRFTQGSTVYRPNMRYNSLSLGTYQSELWFKPEKESNNYVSATYNIGGLGGVSPGTKEIINTFHSSAIERQLYPESGLDPQKYRSHLTSAGELDMQYAINGYRQHIYSDFGWRKIAAVNQTGISGFYPDQYWKVQADGRLPLGNSFDSIVSINYLLNISHRDAMGAEYNFNPEEIMQNNNYSASMYLSNRNVNTKSLTQWTAGLTWASNTHRHQNKSFVRNLVDQDGDAFDMWMPDGVTHEISFSTTVEHSFGHNDHTPDWKIYYKGFNSMVAMQPDYDSWPNSVVWHSMFGNENQDLYQIDWQSKAFTAGIIENTVGVEADYHVLTWMWLNGKIDFTLDGILLGGSKSFVRPNYQAQFSIVFNHGNWFDMAITFGNYRIAFGMDEVRFFSEDYLNGEMRYSDGTLFGTTGGKYHRLDNKTWQQRYALIDIPIRFRFGNDNRHEISILSSYKKFYHLWTTRFDGGSEQYGFYFPSEMNMQDDVFFLNNSEKYYVVNYQKTDEVGNNFFNNTAWWASNMIKYVYNGKKVFVAMSWQSFIGAGIAALGNGALSNDVGLLSESQANPNMLLVTTNQTGSAFKQVGRLDQDKAYVGRLMLAYNITDEWRLGLTLKFTDGEPFSNFNYQFYTDSKGNLQVALWNGRTKGINPVDKNFGSRKDSFFNLDMNMSYRGYYGKVSTNSNTRKRWELQIYGYNLYDFGTELAEFTFYENNSSGNRNAMILCIPRGLMANVMFEL